MKKILLSLFVLAVIGFTAKVQAQCTLKDVVVTIVPPLTPAGSGCTVNFNLNFKLKNNGGNKTVVIQAWKDADYPNYWGPNCDAGKGAPKLADLRKTTSPYTPGSPGPLPFLNIAFDIATQTVIASANYPGGGVTLGSGYTVIVGALDVDGFYPIALNNLTVTVPNQICGNGATIRADVWSSQGSVNSQWQPHCVICNNVYSFNYPTVTAQVLCLIPRRYVTNIFNNNTDQNISVTWKTYFDDAPTGGSRGPEDIRLADEMTTPTQVNFGTNYNTNRAYTYLNDADGNKRLWVVVTTDGLANTTNFLAFGPVAGCIGLPVDFKSFTATRNRSNVLLKWETASEQNNSGFAVERNISGLWEQVAFIPSQAANGNSNDALSYQFTDLNNTKGITQYRIRQVDFDTKSKYSEIRSVRGDGQKGKIIIYPNPSTNGKVNVVFEETNVTRDISVVDMTGRTVKQIKGVTNNNITIDNLTPGMYTLRVFVPATGDQTVGKIMVNKR